MAFHLPRPLHGWRAFIGEIGVIVLGVLIALGAGKVVDALQWKELVKQENASLDEEIQRDHGALLARAMMQRCIDRRLAQIGDVFTRHDAHQPLKPIAPIGRPTVFSGSKSALTMATADESLVHMPIERKRELYSAYGAYDAFASVAEEERTEWIAMQSLDHVATLDPADWRDLRKAFDGAIDANATMKTNLGSDTEGQWLTPFKPFPLPPGDIASLRRALHALPYVRKLCGPASQSARLPR